MTVRTKSRQAVLAAAVMLVSASVIAAPAVAAHPGPAPAYAVTDDGDTQPRMGDYPATAFREAAEELPEGQVSAIRRDLEIEPDHFLARAEAAADAVEVVDALVADGVGVLGSRLDGTALVVNVATAAEAERVEGVGGIAELGAPDIPDFSHIEFEAVDDLYGGQGWYWQDGRGGHICSVGFTGFSSTGTDRVVTAGHCFTGIGSRDAGTGIRTIVQPLPGAYDNDYENADLGGRIGDPVSGSAQFGGGYDVGLLAATASGADLVHAVLSWGADGRSAPFSTAPVAVTGQTAGISGADICKSGATSGWTCGLILGVDESATVSGKSVNVIVSDMCMLSGDSGGAALIGSLAVGINSGSTYEESCSEAGEMSVVFPMVSSAGKASVAEKYGSGFAFGPGRPGVNGGAGGSEGIAVALRGSVSHAGAGTEVEIRLNGAATPVATVPVSSGTWSYSLKNLDPGRYSYNVRSVLDSRGWVSAARTGSFTIAERLAGADRYTTGIAIAKAWDADNDADVVYVATGANYPDALSAGAAAVHEGAPVILTPPTSLPANVRNQIIALDPDRIVVIGGTGAISNSVYSSLRSIVGSSAIERRAGSDRYATSRTVTAEAFSSGGGLEPTPTVFIATGRNFPDALSAGAAAASEGAPVILVDGALSRVPSATVKLIRDLRATKVVIAGGSGVVSNGIRNQLDALPGVSVARYGGADRYGTSQRINAAFFDTAPNVLLATGTNYPDALAGAALAGARGAPLAVTMSGCIPSATRASLEDWDTDVVTLLGGTGVLTESVARLRVC